MKTPSVHQLQNLSDHDRRMLGLEERHGFKLPARYCLHCKVLVVGCGPHWLPECGEPTSAGVKQDA